MKYFWKAWRILGIGAFATLALQDKLVEAFAVVVVAALIHAVFELPSGQ